MRKILKILSCVFLLSGTFLWAGAPQESSLKREELFEFTQKPQATPIDRGVRNTFASKAFCDASVAKERVFRGLVPAPADHYVDLFWARLLPYVAEVETGQSVDYSLLVRNNLERPATYEASLLAPAEWNVSKEFQVLKLEPGSSGKLKLAAKAPQQAGGIRRLITAEIRIDGENQGPISEALVTVRGG